MKPIKTIIVDDEPLARKRILSLLEKENDFMVIKECENGTKAIEAIESLAPDLVFLDIQMPRMDGFEVLKRAKYIKIPRVVFVSAYDQYAVKAFEVHALDYILKPFEDERFYDTLNRVRDQIKSSNTELLSLLTDLQEKQNDLNRLLVKASGRIFFLPTRKIDWIEAAGNYIRIHAESQIHLMRETMSGVASQLSKNFVRVHRSAIINLSKIKEMHPSVKGEYDIELVNGDVITLSRKYRAVLEERLGKPI